MLHVVKQGETLYQISLDYRRPFSMILAANPGLNPNIIVPGQVILIPDLPDKTTIPYSILIAPCRNKK